MSDDLERAADALGDLLRRRDHPTSVGGVYDAIGHVTALAESLGTLTRRLAGELGRLAADPALRADDLGAAVDPAWLATAAARLLRTAADLTAAVSSGIRTAHNDVSHLYRTTTDEETTR